MSPFDSDSDADADADADEEEFPLVPKAIPMRKLKNPFFLREHQQALAFHMSRHPRLAPQSVTALLEECSWSTSILFDLELEFRKDSGTSDPTFMVLRQLVLKAATDEILLVLEHSPFDVVVAHEHFTNEELHTKLKSASTGPSRTPRSPPA
jgi:hypothetical protein